MIDLSFLTEKEQEAILAVLTRDAELKKAEEKRVQNLQNTLTNKRQLRYLTGEWFYETKQLRHRDRVHGSDIIRASIKPAQKPLTIMKLSHMSPESSSFVNSENKEVFIPPVLCGLLEDPEEHSDGYRIHSANETLHSTQKKVLRSPIQLRKNPFDRELTSEEMDEAVDQTQSSEIRPADSNISDFTDPEPNATVSQDASGSSVIPENKVSVSSQDCAVCVEHEAGQHQVSGDVCRCFSKSEPLIPAISSFVSVAKEPGKPHHLGTKAEEDCQAEAGDWPAVHNIQALEAVSCTKPTHSDSSKSASLELLLENEHQVLGGFTRENEKTIQKQNLSDIKLTMISQKDKCYHKIVADVTEDKPLSDRKEIKPTQMTDGRSLQAAALQNSQFKETQSSLDSDTDQDRPINQVTQSSKRPSHLKTHSEKEKTVFHFRVGPQKKSDRKKENRPELEDNPAGRAQESRFIKQTENDRMVNSSKDNETHKSDLVLSCEETDDPLTGSGKELQATEQQESIISLALNIEKLEQYIPPTPPTQSTSTPEGGSPVTHGTKHLFKPPSKFFTSVNEGLSKSIIHHNTDSCHSNPGISSKYREEPDGSKLRNFGSTVVSQSPCHQDHMKTETESDHKDLSHSKYLPSRVKDDNVKSPSKTYHPKVLPLESSSNKGSELEGSPLKTFSVDIDPKTNIMEEQQVEPTQVPRQTKIHTHGTKQTTQTDTNLGDDITCPSPPRPSSHSIDGETCLGQVNLHGTSNTSASSEPEQAPENIPETSTLLTRAFITQDFQYDHGPQAKGFSPYFHQDTDAIQENDTAYIPQGAHMPFLKKQDNIPTEGNTWIIQKKVRNSSPKTTTRTQSPSWKHAGNSSPILSTLEEFTSKSMSSSKTSSLPNSNTMKQSFSELGLQQGEMGHNSTSNLKHGENASSSMSNLSVSSGMASISSVSSSTSSLYLLHSGDTGVVGSIQFAVNYIQKLGELQIFVVLCRGLAIADTKKNRSDPYVKCYFSPDKTRLGKRKSTVKKKTVNPTYNEVLRFKITMDELKMQNLIISVWHNDPFGRNSFLGEVDLDLSEWNFNSTEINEYILKPRVSAEIPAASTLSLLDSTGQMRVALRFVPQTFHSKKSSRLETGELLIWVKDCRNLPPVRSIIINPFVKCVVLPDMSWKSQQKTRVVKKTANPMFNHTMVYDGFRSEDLSEACVELTVWDHNRLRNLFIGGVRLGPGTGRSYNVEVTWMDSTKNEVDLWNRMLQSNGEWVEEVLPLRMLVMAKSMSKGL